MKLQDMKCILAIEKHMNISRAAEELYISQSTLSKSLQKVEEEIGQPLFNRVGKRLVITYSGKVFVEQARKIVELEKNLTQQLKDIIKNNCGLLKVAFPIMRATYMLPEILPRYRELYPNVQVTVLESHSNNLDVALLRGDIDIAFYNQGTKNPSLEYINICTEELVLVSASDSAIKEKAVSLPDCKYPYISLNSISDQLFILTNKKQRTRQVIDDFLVKENINLSNTIEISNILAGIHLAERGYGLTLTSERHISHFAKTANISLFSVAVPGILTDFVAAKRRNFYISDYAQKFIDIVRECY